MPNDANLDHIIEQAVERATDQIVERISTRVQGRSGSEESPTITVLDHKMQTMNAKLDTMCANSDEQREAIITLKAQRLDKRLSLLENTIVNMRIRVAAWAAKWGAFTGAAAAVIAILIALGIESLMGGL